MIDLTGQKFNRLTVIRRDKNTKHGHTTWLCMCNCGKTSVVRGYHLLSGKIKSCGCLKVESASNCLHGHSRKNKISPTYHSWVRMKGRCNDPSNNRYHRYGGRGITVCDRWLKFDNFLSDMGERPDGHQLDRINNDLGYYKENCRWVTPVQNSRNRSKNNLLSFRGKTQCIAAWAEELGINKSTIQSRFWRGWSIKRTLSEQHK